MFVQTNQTPDRQTDRPTDRQTERETDRETDRPWYCGPTCKNCGEPKCERDWGKRDATHRADRCQRCQFPSCDKCGSKYEGAKPIPARWAPKGRWRCRRCK